MNEKTLSLADTIIEAITTSDEWGEIQMTDPMILHNQQKMNAIMEKAKAHLPEELFDELDDVALSVAVAWGDAGILFGIRAAAAVQAVAGDPAARSRHILERMKERGTPNEPCQG